MKDQILVPDTGEKVPPSVIPVNHEKLSAALRRDMREASEELLKLRAWLEYVQDLFETSTLTKAIMNHVDSALAALDCTDHLQSIDDGTD